MYEPIWNNAVEHISGERVKAEAASFFQESRWSSYDHINALAGQIAEKMKALGMVDVELIEAPADGRTSFGGWLMPKAYDVEDAKLLLLENNNQTQVLADYLQNPTSLMLYSMPTPPEGQTAELVVVDDLAQITPQRVRGRLVLSRAIGVYYGQAVARAGAVGLISDHGPPFGPHNVTEDRKYLKRINRWHNYTIPPWEDPNKGFGFAISAEQGERLRARINKGERLTLKALVKSRHYDGILPLVSGRLPGKSPDEIAITGHYDEFGADDNCSHVAVALEAIRAIQVMIKNGQLAPLERTVRVLLPMEARGFNALIQDPEQTKHLKLGLNIDTVGTDQIRFSAVCNLIESFTALPSFTDELAAELLRRVQQKNKTFQWQRVHDVETVDNIFGEPLVGAPTPVIYHFSDTHHMAEDTPEQLSTQTLAEMAAVTTTYVAFLANASLKEAGWLADLTARRGIDCIRESAENVSREQNESESPQKLLRKVEALRQRYGAKVDSVRCLVPIYSNFMEQALPQNVQAPQISTPLLPREQIETQFPALHEKIDQAAQKARTEIERAAKHFDREIELPPRDIPASRCIPVKAFRGFLSFEDLGEQARGQIEKFGIQIGWSSPPWLMNALTLANGKRTLGEIVHLMDLHGLGGPGLNQMQEIFEFLAERGQVSFRPYLTGKDIRTALRLAGCAAGDVVLAHFSLSNFGYIEGGADTLIDATLDVLGPTATLVMPTFTFSWAGHPPYDPQTSPSRAGTVTDRFWRRDGVLRSLHPTHSFAAFGKQAEFLLAGHDHKVPPLSKNGPIGKLYELDGKILMFCPIGSNTSMHAGEYWAGIPYPSLVCHVIADGQTRQVVTPDCPYHAIFINAYEKLYARKQITKATLGESNIHLMRARHAIDAQAEVARKDPTHLFEPDCDCSYCQAVQAYCQRITQEPSD